MLTYVYRTLKTPKPSQGKNPQAIKDLSNPQALNRKDAKRNQFPPPKKKSFIGGLQEFLPCVFPGRPFATVCHAQDMQVQKILETRDIDEAQAHEFHLEVRLVLHLFASFYSLSVYIFLQFLSFRGPVVLFLHLDFILLRRLS